MNFTEFYKCTLNFILKFSTVILTKRLQSYFFIVTVTLNSEKSDSESESLAPKTQFRTSLTATVLWVKRRHVGLCKI